MDTIHTLSQLLIHSDCQYQVYDLGRRIKRIDSKTFSDVEHGLKPYPYPLQRKAHLAICYWNESKQPWIWFLKFELDERGLLKQAEVGNFLKYVIEAMGTRISKEMTQEQQQKLANNPYTFKPADDKMAVFHSQIRAQLSLPCSQYYQHAQHYFSGELGWDKWQTVGLQGVTDICARLDEEQNGVHVRKAIKQLPNEPLYALLGALEHSCLPDKLSERLQEFAVNKIDDENPDIFLIGALTRALSGANEKYSKPIIENVLLSARLSHQEVLIGIAGRCWHLLTKPDLAELFLLRLAQTGNQTLFNQLFADLVMVPELRMVLLPLLHSKPSEELAHALTMLQQATKG